MTVTEALLERKSVRAFQDRPVSQENIGRILEAARHAPSGTNTQPWEVAVVTGETKALLIQRLEDAFQSGREEAMDYRYYPYEWKSPFKERRRATGLQLYGALGITRQDKTGQIRQWRANYSAFGAPVILFFFLDRVMQTGSFLDYGMFLQSLMLAAVEEGLATCPQVALAQYPDIVKETLGYSAESTLVCGMALGYEDTAAAANSYRTPREDVDSFSRFFH